MITVDDCNRRRVGTLVEHLGILFTALREGAIEAEMPIGPPVMAANGYLHAGSVVSLADSCAGFGCIAHLPPTAASFTTIELKSNFVGTARNGVVVCVATLIHAGRTTQLWDATVTHRETARVMAHFRCTQLLLSPPPAGASVVP
jgi:1,4-dihydroxy-2-naphthoyl-CoA hydrolase